MKQDIATYSVDSFTDFEGKKHKIVACALSQSPINQEGYSLKIGWSNERGRLDTQNLLYHDVYRLVTIGIAVCNPDDEFNRVAGEKIAFNRAANVETAPRIYAPCKGVITKELVDTFLKQQIQFFKENPEKFIAGYKEAKESYEETQKTQEIINNFTDEEKVIFDLAVKGIDLSKYVKLAKVYIKKILKNA